MDYLRKLQSREKILLLAMIVLIIIVCMYLFFSYYINQSKLAKSKLLSAKSDYEYVYKRYQQIERSVNLKLNNNKSKLSSSINSYLLSQPVEIHSIKTENDDLIVNIKSKDLSSLTTVINELSEKYDLPIKYINFVRDDSLIDLEIIVD